MKRARGAAPQTSGVGHPETLSVMIEDDVIVDAQRAATLRAGLRPRVGFDDRCRGHVDGPVGAPTRFERRELLAIANELGVRAFGFAAHRSR